MRNKKDLRAIRIAIFILLVFGLIFSLIQPSEEKIFEMRINKQAVGYADSQNELEKMLENVESELMERYYLSELSQYYEPYYSKIPKGELEASNYDSVRTAVLASQKFVTPGFELSVEGKVYARAINRSDLEFVIECVKSRLRNEHEDIHSIDFRENVEIVPGKIFLRETLGQAESDLLVERLLTGRETIETYIVKKGDTLSLIASTHALDIEALLEANPGIDIDRIYAGQSLYLSKPSPIVHRK